MSAWSTYLRYLYFIIAIILDRGDPLARILVFRLKLNPNHSEIRIRLRLKYPDTLLLTILGAARSGRRGAGGGGGREGGNGAAQLLHAGQ